MVPLLLLLLDLLSLLACGAVPQATSPSIKLAWLPSWTQINATSFPGNKGGIEDGIVVRRQDGGFSMIGAETVAHKENRLLRLLPFAWGRNHAVAYV